jgi:transcriptional regulator with PAS, ATPase and Fis domain
VTKPVPLDELEKVVAAAWERHELVETPVADLEPARESSTVGEMVARAADLNLESIEQAAIREALRRARDNRRGGADLLGISERTLYYRLSQVPRAGAGSRGPAQCPRGMRRLSQPCCLPSNT